MKIKIFALLSLSIWTTISIAAENSLIIHRSIIYFYPDVSNVKPSDIAKQFKGFELVDDLPDTVSSPYVSIAVETDFQDFIPVPDIRQISYFGRGLSKDQAESIQQTKQAAIIDVAYPESMSFEKLQAVSKALLKVATDHTGAIYDSETREIFESSAWKEYRVDSWEEGIPNVDKHTVIHAYQNDDGGIRAISLGMAKFKQPDVVINNFSWSQNTQMGNLINLIVQSLVEGSKLTDKDVLKLDVDSLADTQFKRTLLPTFKENAERQLAILFSEATWEEGDPLNKLIEVDFQQLQGDSLSEQQNNLVSMLFGYTDEVVYIKQNELIGEASDRAKQKLPSLSEDFNAGLEPGEYIMVKAPFETTDDGIEWMWVEVMAWKGQEITGLLMNEPRSVPSLRAGAEVVVSQDDIFDYIRTYADGTEEGNETGELIRQFSQ